MISLKTDRDFVLYDSDESDGPVPLFQSCIRTHLGDGVAKSYNKHYNLLGCGGALPMGWVFDVKSIRVLNWHDDPRRIEGSPRVEFRDHYDGPATFDQHLEPGVWADLPKTVRLWATQNFQVYVHGTQAARVELRGDMHRSRHDSTVGGDGASLFYLHGYERDVLAKAVELALPKIGEKKDRADLSRILSSLKINDRFTGFYYAAQIIAAEEVKVVPFQTDEERKAYQNGANAVSAVTGNTSRCWLLPEELEAVGDDLKQKVNDAWYAALAPYRGETLAAASTEEEDAGLLD